MQQSIRFKGLSLTPDEMAVENGALSLCGNLELHDGALRPAIISGTSLASALYIGDSENIAKLLYIHETGSYKHLIGIHSNSIYWFDSDGSYMDSIYTFSSEATIQSVNSVGNTLIIIATNGIHYAIFHPDSSGYSSYQWLGQKPPFLDIGFSINTTNHADDYDLGGIDSKSSSNGFFDCFQQTSFSCSDIFSVVDNDSFSLGEICASIKEEKQSDITQSIYALVNRTNNVIARNGRFYANFFVRYCYRMFDGSMIMHSAPVFMPVQVPNSYAVASANLTFNKDDALGDVFKGKINVKDTVKFSRLDGDNQPFEITINKVAFYYYPRNVSLLYSLSGDTYQLKLWKDVIKSVDVFITPPITNIDTAEKITSLAIYKPNYGLGAGRVDNYTYGNDTDVVGCVRVNFPTISDDVYQNKLVNTLAFYKVCSLNLDDLIGCNERTLPVDKQAIYEVSLQEQMKDDYKTHNSLLASGSYVYNHRLNLYGVKEVLFSGFNRMVMFPYLDKLNSDSTNSYIQNHYKIRKIVTILNTSSGKKHVVVNDDSEKNVDAYMLANLVKFYPDSRATQMIMYTTRMEDSIPYVFSFPLTPCNEINGSMHMGDFNHKIEEFIHDPYSYTADDIVDLSNKIYTSEADNAFYFPVNAINTVGIGTIQGIAATTRALSQGQFGQYPLMAFSTDGIWAMDVSAQGTYSSIHPISRDVCSNPLSITQLDQSVFFVTNRSANRVAESQIASMSDVLDGPFFNIVSHMGKFFNYFLDASSDSEETKLIKSQMRQLIDFSESPIDFFQRCQVIYDYKNSRIFCLDVSNNTKSASADTVALCYSIRDQAWSTLLIKNVLTALNSYPHPYIQFRDGSVICLDKGYDYSDDTQYHGIIVTRTLKFDEDGVPDSITGYLHSLTTDSVPIMWLYGSHDNQNWHYLGRCGGMKSSYMVSKSYRYFRIALYLKMKTMSQYFATRLEVIRRFGKF